MKQSMPPGSDWERAGDAARSRGQVAAVLLVGVLIAALVSFDGESSWLEGATLLAVYLILGLAFFLLP